MAKKVRDQADASGIAVGAGKKDSPSNASARAGMQEVFQSMPGDRESGTGIRQTIGDTAFKPNAPGNTNPRLQTVKKGNAKGGGDPSMGTATHEGGVLQRERLGPRFSTAVQMPQSMPQTPEAGYNQANGRIIRSAVRRDRTNFVGGMLENRS